MRGGQPPLAPKSSHKVLRSFPPPHRLRGKPLKIPQKILNRHCEEPVQGDVAIQCMHVSNDRLVIARSEATKQSINREFCRAKLGKHADACDSLRGAKQSSVCTSLRGAKRRGNPLYARHCEIFARKSWQSINQRSLPGLLRRFTPRNDGVAKYSVTARLRKKSWQSSDCTNIFWVASLRTQRHFFSRTQRQCIKKSHRKQTLYTFYIFYLCNIIIF